MRSSTGGQPDASSYNRGSAFKFVAALGMACLLSAASGVAFALRVEFENPRAASPGQSQANETDRMSGASLMVMEIPPVITNLDTPSDVWIRLESAIIYDASELKSPEVITAMLADDFLSYLRTLSLNELQGSLGLESLRQELADRAAVRSKRQVKEVVLKTVVVQ